MAKQGDGGIGWTEETWNPVRGCNLLSPGCKNCYAMSIAARFSGPGMPYEGLAYRTTQGPKWTGKIMLVHDALLQPMRWSKPRKVFVNSMSDLFHDGIPDSFIDECFAVMALAGQHTYQILTKRSARMRQYLSDPHCGQRVFAAMRAITGADLDHSIEFKQPKWPLRNVWMGISAENQEYLQERIDDLFYTPAAVRWLSLEPLLGRIDLCEALGMYWNSTMQCFEATGAVLNRGRGRGGIDWVVVGAESGHGARIMDVEWLRALARQCKGAGMPLFAKQLSGAAGHVIKDVSLFPSDLQIREYPENVKP